MIRLSVSWLDQFLYWQSQEDMPVEDFIARLKGVPEPTPQMRAGHALHALLEGIEIGEVFGAYQDGLSFKFTVDVDLPLAPIRELKGEQVIDTRFGPVTLVGKVDAMDGRLIRDYKLTERFDAERYSDSYQWRAYLMMFEARTFVYDVFSGKIEDDKVTIFGYDRLQLCAYPGMETDVRRLTTDVAEIISKYWPERLAA